MTRPDLLNDLRAPSVAVSGSEAVRIWRELAAGQWRVVTATAETGTRRIVLTRAPHQMSADWGRLSAFERCVLDLASRGMPQKAIAIEIQRSPSTVSNTLRRIRIRLGFSTLTQLGCAYRASKKPEGPRP